MATILIQALPPIVPEGFCPSGETAIQQITNFIVNGTRYSLAGNVTFLNFGNSIPAPDMRVFPWLRTVGGFPERLYSFYSGMWLAKHAIEPGITVIAPKAINTQALVDAFDGGSAGSIGLATGPMWQIDHDFDGRSPIGPGAIPGSNPPITVGIGDSPGVGSLVLTQLQLPLSLNLTAQLPGHRGNPETLAPLWLAPRGSGGVFNTTPPIEAAAFAFDNAGGGQPLQTLSPSHVRYFLQKSARQFYAIPA